MPSTPTLTTPMGEAAHRGSRLRDEGAPAPAARAQGLRKVYGAGPTRVTALDGVDVAFARGELTAIMGPSGSGKSTLMHCVAGLDTADGGTVWVGDTELTALGDRALTELRRDQIGFIFQSFNLLPTSSTAENITLPADIAGRTVDPRWLDHVIDTVGLRDRLGHRPTELSGGQQQRVACARALAGRPELIFADEPTGNLDSHAAIEVLGFLRRTVDDLGQSIVLVTHDPAAAAYADRVLFLADGRIVDQLTGPTAATVLDTMKQLESPTTVHRVGPARDSGRASAALVGELTGRRGAATAHGEALRRLGQVHDELIATRTETTAALQQVVTRAESELDAARSALARVHAAVDAAHRDEHRSVTPAPWATPAPSATPQPSAPAGPHGKR